MAIFSCCHVSDNFPMVVVAALYDQLRWVFMEFLIQGKVILNLRFEESFKTSGAQHLKIPLMIGWTIGAKRLYPAARMFFKTLKISSFNFGLVSRIEKCVGMEVVPFVIASFKCGLSSPLDVNHS
jgi:hypothetical protein